MMGEGSVLGDREAHENAVTLGGGKGKPQPCPGGLREGSSEKATRPVTKLKCLFISAHSMGNKQEEIETVIGKCLSPIYRRERRFVEICISSVRLRNNGPDVGPISLLQILIRKMGKGRMDDLG